MAQAFSKKFYDSKLWKDAREYVLKRDRYQCQDCKVMAAEEVHHIKELTPDNINDPMVSINPSNLISLCYNCHKLRHRKSKSIIKTDYEFDAEGNIIPPV